MRYYFIPLSLALILGACGEDPTAPSVNPLPLVKDEPKVDGGRTSTKPIPITDPGICARVDQGGFELLPHPVCKFPK